MRFFRPLLLISGISLSACTGQLENSAGTTTGTNSTGTSSTTTSTGGASSTLSTGAHTGATHTTGTTGTTGAALTTGGGTATTSTGGGATSAASQTSTTGQTAQTTTTGGSATTTTTTGGGTGSTTGAAPATYHLSVNATGVVFDQGPLIVVDQSTAQNLTFTQDGNQTFAAPYANGDTYLLGVTQSPNTLRCLFESSQQATSAATTLAGADAVETVTCYPTYHVQLSVAGLTAGKSATVFVTGNDYLTYATNGNQTFNTTFINNASLSIYINQQPPGLYCVFASSNSTFSTQTVQGADVSDTLLCKPVTLSVHATNVRGSLTVANDANEWLTFNADGNQTFSANYDHNGNFNVRIVSSPNQTVCTLGDSGSMQAPQNALNSYTYAVQNVVRVGCAYPASYVFGQPDFVSSTYTTASAESISPLPGSGFWSPVGVYIGDSGNNRVLGLDPNFASSQMRFVLGQADFTQDDTHVDSNGFSFPTSVSGNGNTLMVVDSASSRVLIYTALPTHASTPAAFVIGQDTFNSASSGCSSHQLNSPEGGFVFEDSPGHQTFVVADTYNCRILIYSGMPTANNPNASQVLGQPDFNTCTCNQNDPITANSLQPLNVWANANSLMAADVRGNRVLVWNSFPPITGAAANVVLGQSDFTQNAAVLSATGLYSPSALTVAHGIIWVADTAHNRVVGFADPPSTGAAAVRLLGQFAYDAAIQYSGGAIDRTSLAYPSGITWVAPNQLLIADASNHRLLLFVAP